MLVFNDVIIGHILLEEKTLLFIELLTSILIILFHEL